MQANNNFTKIVCLAIITYLTNSFFDKAPEKITEINGLVKEVTQTRISQTINQPRFADIADRNDDGIRDLTAKIFLGDVDFYSQIPDRGNNYQLDMLSRGIEVFYLPKFILREDWQEIKDENGDGFAEIKVTALDSKSKTHYSKLIRSKDSKKGFLVYHHNFAN